MVLLIQSHESIVSSCPPHAYERRTLVASAMLRTLLATLLQLTQHGTGLGSSHFESHVPIYSIKPLHLRTHVLSVSDLSAPHPWITKTQQAFISSTLESTTNSNQFQPIPPNSRNPGFKLQQCTNFCSSDPWRQVSTPKARTANDSHSDPNPFHLAKRILHTRLLVRRYLTHLPTLRYFPHNTTPLSQAQPCPHRDLFTLFPCLTF